MEGKLNGENGSFPRPAVHRNPSLMDLNNLLGDRQAESASAGGAVAGFVRFIKPLKDAVLILLVDSRPGVGDGDDRPVAPFLKPDGDPSSLRREFDGIMDQVQPHLTQQVLI